jgi:hypothetical protein
MLQIGYFAGFMCIALFGDQSLRASTDPARKIFSPKNVVAFTLKVTETCGGGTHFEGTIKPSAPQLAGVIPAYAEAAVMTDA